MIKKKKSSFKQKSININGLDDLFKTDKKTLIVPNNLKETKNTDNLLTDWTPEEAAKVLGKSVRTIRRLLQDGTLNGYKTKGLRRDEWRIYPLGHSDGQKPSEKYQSDIQSISKQDPAVTELKTKIETLEHKLESSLYRIGYLEAQLQNKEEQLKLITDNQPKSSWFKGIISQFNNHKL